MPQVTIYSTPTCGYCKQAKAYLAEKGIAYTEYDVSADQAKAEEMIHKTGQMGVPVIEVNGQIMVGYDKTTLEKLLANS